MFSVSTAELFLKQFMVHRKWYAIDPDFDLCFTEYKRSRQEIKRKSLDTIKLQKKARKGKKLF